MPPIRTGQTTLAPLAPLALHRLPSRTNDSSPRVAADVMACANGTFCFAQAGPAVVRAHQRPKLMRTNPMEGKRDGFVLREGITASGVQVNDHYTIIVPPMTTAQHAKTTPSFQPSTSTLSLPETRTPRQCRDSRSEAWSTTEYSTYNSTYNYNQTPEA